MRKCCSSRILLANYSEGRENLKTRIVPMALHVKIVKSMKVTCKSSKEKLDSILEYIIIHIVRATVENFHRQSRRTSKRFQEGKKRNRAQGLKSQETSLGNSKII